MRDWSGAAGRGRNCGPAAARWSRCLPWLFALYAAATLLHFAHNAEHLVQYPNLPASWSRGEVYAAWCWVMALGLLGYGLYALGHRRAGLAILGLYAALGFGGLLHYTRAPLHEHSATMNVTIWTEAAMGTLLLANVALLARPWRAKSTPAGGAVLQQWPTPSGTDSAC